MPLDRFSLQAKSYAQFRPSYPAPFIEEVVSSCSATHCAWDCATGNGQVAVSIADHFHLVEATDISEQQLKNSVKRENINYQVGAAEKTSFEDEVFDLVTVAQAIHWFDHSKLFSEVDRVLKYGGIFATWGYGLFRFNNDALNNVISWFYENIMGEYWDPQRRLIESQYDTIEFPYPAIKAPSFKIPISANVESIIAFFETWSSVDNYRKAKKEDPIPLVRERLLSKFDPDNVFQGYYPRFSKIVKKL